MNKLLVVLSLLLSSLSQCQNPSLQLPTASVADNFIGGRPEYYNVFMTKIEYPEQLYKDKITGTVYFEIEIDTSGQIVNFRIQKGVSPLMNQEVEKKYIPSIASVRL